MPKAKSLLAGITFQHILTKTLPGMIGAWNVLGFTEYHSKHNPRGEFVVCKRPPSHFLTCHQPPRSYERTVCFINGYTIEFGSMERPDDIRGANYDSIDIDESGLFKREHVDKIILPTLRGNVTGPTKIGSKLHHSFFHVTSSPWTLEGQWVFEYEELAKSKPDRYFFSEGKTSDNVAVLGEAYIEMLKDTLTDLEYEVECNNMRLRKLPNSFYPSFNESRHTKTDTYEYDYNETESGLFMFVKNENTFISKLDNLLLSFDFNAGFTSCLVCQEADIAAGGKELRVGDNLFVKPGQSETNMIDALVDKFVKEYASHGRKHVEIYGDRNGNNRQSNSTRTYYEQIIDRLRQHHWTCKLNVSGLDPDHRLKYVLINSILREDKVSYPRIRINRNKCKALIMSINNSPITQEWKKDKSSEKKKSIDQAQATHLSDCFDLIVYGRYSKLLRGRSSLAIAFGSAA